MPIISAIGRRHWRVRALLAGLYACLALGAASMVYPFLLMLAGSTQSAVDSRRHTVLPGFLFDDTWLYRKYAEGLFNEQIQAAHRVYGNAAASFERFHPPPAGPDALRDAWREFIAAEPLPDYAWLPGFLMTPASRTMPLHLRGLKRAWQRAYGRRIEAVNARLGTHFTGWNTVSFTVRPCLLRRDLPDPSPLRRALVEYFETAPLEHRVYDSIEGFYRYQYLQPQYPSGIEAYNRAHGTRHAAWSDVRLPRTWAGNGTGPEKADWETFVREIVSLAWLRAGPEALPAYRAYLARKYRAIGALNRAYGTDYPGFDAVPLPDEPVGRGVVLSDWGLFVAGWRDPDSGLMHQAPLRALRIHSVEFLFRDWLARRHGGLAGINRALGLAAPALEAIQPPQRALHAAWFRSHAGAMRREFLARNYAAVADYVLRHGRGARNTAVYCVLAVLCALTVNPLAAYALSRFKMPAAYKVLLFLMATMAFPPMVTGIQTFLMLKRLSLLNTFGALVLPGLANGYAIFLLKGFFDSQPRELYESAALDGAGEWTLFWQIAMSLSKPILAVIALQAFTAAYSNFMFAFITCQDERMWTLMVWLYQLQQTSGPGVRYAALIVAAVPTLLVFAGCQQVIMRGIVVPTEK